MPGDSTQAHCCRYRTGAAAGATRHIAPHSVKNAMDGSDEVEQVDMQLPDLSASDWRQLCLGVLLLLMSAGAWVWLMLHGGVPDLPLPEKNKAQVVDGDQAGAQSVDGAAELSQSNPAGLPEPTDDLRSDTDPEPEPLGCSRNSNRGNTPPGLAHTTAAGGAIAVSHTQHSSTSFCRAVGLTHSLDFNCCPWLDWPQNSIKSSGPLPRYDRGVHDKKGRVISRRPPKKTFSCCSNTKIASLDAVEPDATKVR
eukprot:SAG31_NODE_7815_length_1590_cov_1.864520_2_plen_252_part_00